MTQDSPRIVTLVLCLADGRVLGATEPFEVPVPWWQDAASVVDAARHRLGVEVTVLRLLHAAGEAPDGGAVSYLAEVDAPVASLLPYREPLADHPLRLPYARPGGPAADLAWADEALRSIGRARTSAATQVRTWNLSSLWRLPTAHGAAWLKVVPPFFAHEGAILRRLDPAVVPPLLAADGPRVLLDEVPGHDLYDAPHALQLLMVELLVGLQAQWLDRVPELESLGLPDWRAEPFGRLADAVFNRTADQLDPDTRRRCETLIDALPARFAELAACGVPDTLVHGDFHTGNLVGDDHHLTLLDWGDCGIGNPLLDRAAFAPRVAPDRRPVVAQHWDSLWQAAVPGCDPARASDLMAPIAALRQAIVYDTFSVSIEPSERIYHAGDSARWLQTAAELSQH